MLDQLIAPDIKALIEEGKFEEIANFIEDRHPAEAAEILTALPEEDVNLVLEKLPLQTAADIFCELPSSLQSHIAAKLNKNDLAKLVINLSPDDRVDLLKSLPEEQFDSVLPVLAKREREDIKKLASYKEGTAGSIMTTDYIALPADMTVREALDKIRLEGPAKESIYTIFVLDEGRHLVGSVGLADLILAHPSKKLRDIMDDQVIAVQAEADQEEATYKFSRYDLVALPVVDAQGNLVGIITHDDALDVIEQERTEDMERFMAISGKHEDTGYLQTSIWTHFSHRVVWLVILAVLGLVSGAILQSFQETLMNLMILAFYMPMLADTGGNTGSQSATVVVRALVASPALTTIVDISGLFIYFSTARPILGI